VVVRFVILTDVDRTHLSRPYEAQMLASELLFEKDQQTNYDIAKLETLLLERVFKVSECVDHALKLTSVGFVSNFS
jgi:hypothetical protein